MSKSAKRSAKKVTRPPKKAARPARPSQASRAAELTRRFLRLVRHNPNAAAALELAIDGFLSRPAGGAR